MKSRILIASGLGFLFMAFYLLLDAWAQQAQYPAQRGVSFQIGTVPRHRHSGDTDGGGTLQFDAILRDGSTNYGPVAGTTNTHTNLGTLSIAGDSIAGQDRRYATVGGGLTNYAYAEYSTIGGGFSNRMTSGTATAGTIGGGQSNRAGFQATVGGGRNNEARGDNATIPGGLLNTAEGANSFAAGTQARSRAKGAMTLTDSQLVDLINDTTDYFLARFQAGWEVRAPTAVYQNRIQAGSFVGNGAGLTGLSASETNTFNSSKTFNATPVSVEAAARIAAGTVHSTGTIVAGTNIIAGGSLRQSSVLSCSGGLTTSSDGTINGCSAGGETQTFPDPKTFNSSVTIRGTLPTPFQISGALGSSVAVTNVSVTGGGVAVNVGLPGGALANVHGVTVGLSDAYDGTRPPSWFRLAWSDTLEKFGMWRKFDGNRTLNITAGGSALADNCTLTGSGNIAIWTGSAAAVKHLFSGCGRFGLNVGFVNPAATLQVVGMAADDYLVKVTSQNATTGLFSVNRLGQVGVGIDAPCSTCTVQIVGTVNATGAMRQGVALNCSTGVTSDADGKLDGCVVSSRKAKTRIKTAKADLDRFDQLRPVTYDLKRDKTQRPRLGFISEEVGALYPEAEIPAGRDMTGLDPNALAAVLTLEVQDLRRRVARLEKGIPPPSPKKDAGAGALGGLVAGAVAGAAAARKKKDPK